MPHILITGASSGLGAALARAYAKPENTLALWGRNARRLEAVAAECRARSAEVSVHAIDLRDIDEAMARLRELDKAVPLDLAYFNAGIGGASNSELRAELPERVQEMATVNFTAPAVGAAVIAEEMARRGRGHIVLISSVAGAFPLPMAPTYAGTKAGLSMYGEALALRVSRHGVGVTVVSPGFIDTPMNRGEAFAKPFLMQPDAAAAVIVRKVARGRSRVVLPWHFSVIQAAAGVLPRGLLRALLRRL